MAEINNFQELLLETYLGMLEDTIFNETLRYSMEEDEELKRKDDVKVMLEKVKYNEEEPVECEICFENVNKDDTIYNLECYHKYHSDCLMEWMHYKQDCPCCRTPIN